MGVIDAPQWLLPAFSRSVKALGASAPAEQIREAGELLVARWSTPERCFHNLRHVIDMLAHVDELADESHNPDIMRLATWYHGCVFTVDAEQVNRRNGGEDEIASAAFAATDLAALGVPEQTVERICALIVNLKRHTLPVTDIDAMALIDADLASLAVEPQTYKEHLRLLREEHAHICQADYLHARLAITSMLLARDPIFHSPLAQRWELPARQNLEAERRRVTDMLASLPPDEVPATDPAPAPTPHVPTAGAALEAGPNPAPNAAPQVNIAHPEVVVADPTSRTPSPPASADSAHTPAEGVHKVSTPRQRDETRFHTTTMESCIEDLDQLLRSPRAGQERSASRHYLAQEESARLAEKLHLKAEAAKIAREARTGEMAPITAPIVQDEAKHL